MGMTESGRSARRDLIWQMILRQETNISVAVGLLMLVIWALHSGSPFWPRWVWLGLAVPLALQVGIRRGLGAPLGQRLLTVHSAVTVVLALMMLAIWVLAGARGFFWPVWPALGLGIPLALHSWIRHGLQTDRERALIDRVEVLTRTRSGALDVQAAELRRIERDLHDGAQARMVSVAMNLGLAEELIDKDPQSLAELLAESRSSMLTALDELRTVMRGIQPPVLADRGLEGAVRALALHLAVPVTVTSEIPGHAPPPVESAVYFAVSECLANVVKHSAARRAEVELGYRDGVLSVVVSDDGDGGASMTVGTGLRGVARRLEVFDGTIVLASPAGGPTVVRMEVPCELSSPRI
ncbi:MAG TPA: histidine kinase [Streptosporangiaceae bacterium]